MENELKFNSQVCTDINQSKKLLELGLKPETADMYYHEGSEDGAGNIEYHPNIRTECNNILFPDYIPAWSLHRLIELICNKECDEHYYFDLSVDYDSMEDVYDSIIEVIERHIKGKFFNKEYLKQ